MKTAEQNLKHAAYMRAYRKTHAYNPKAVIQRRAGSVVRQYVKAGSMERLPCHVCGNSKVEAHHPDHTKRREVIWLCRPHHLDVTHGRMSLYLTAQDIAKMRVASLIPMFDVDRIAAGIFAKVERLKYETS